MKKVISLFLSLTMLLSIVSVVDFSAYASVKTGKCGDNLKYSLDTETGVLTIRGTGAMYNYTMTMTSSGSNCSSPFYNNRQIKRVIIESGVTSVGNIAFCACMNLMSVAIPDSMINIGDSAFAAGISKVDYNGTVFQWKTIKIGSGNDKLKNAIIICTDDVIGNGNTVTIDNLKYKINNDYTASLVGYTDSPKNLVIPKNISYESGKFKVTSIGNYAFDKCTSLTSVTIPDSVTSIGNFAFNGCRSLTDVTIGNSVTSIGEYAFNGCTSLTNVTIPNSVTSIGSSAFFGCESLTSVTIGNSVTSIGGSVFYGCTNLEKVDYIGTVSQWKSISGYSNVSQIVKCSDNIIINENTVTINNLKYKINNDYTASLVGYTDSPENLEISKNISYESYTFKVRSIGERAFYNCTSLTSVTIPNSVTSIGDSAFYDCTSLTSVNYSGTKSQWKDITVGSDNYYLTHAFIKCTDGIIGNGNTVTVDSVEYKLNDDYTARVISYSGTPENITISESVWYEGYTFKVTSIDSAFDGCTSLTSVTIPNSVTRIDNKAFYNCTSLTSVKIPDSVTSIGCYAFENCTSLTSITIPNSVKSIVDYAFAGCRSLTSVKIPDSVTRIGNDAFENCESLTNVTIGNSVTSIGHYAFSNCTNLTRVNYSGTVSQWKSITIGSNNSYLTGAIIKCTDGVIGNENTVIIDSLKYKIYNNYTTSLVGYTGEFENLTIPESVTYEGYTFSVTRIDNKAFYNYTSLTSITIPDSVTTIGSSAFYGCTSLTSVTIGNSVTSIGDYAFYDCTSLTSVKIGNNVTSIGSYTFEYCTSLTSVTIPDSVTSIGYSAFCGCTSLTSVTIPGSVTSIGRSTFYNCTSLTSIDYNGTVSQWKSIKGYGNVSKIIKCTDGIIGNGNTVTIDNLKYKIYDDTASLVGYVDTPENLMIPKSFWYDGYTFKVSSIGVEAFYNCTSLTSVTIPNSVTSIGSSAFSGCTSLKSFNYSGTKSQWKAITIGSDNYYLTHAFIKCTDGIIGNGNTVTVDSVKYRLNDDYTAEVISYSGTPGNITILESVTYEGLTFKVTSIGSSAFSNCTSLKSATIPDSVASIGDSAFSGCTSLTSVTIPNSVESIGDNAFQNCSSLTSATIGNNVTSIGSSAFFGCSKLKKIEIPDSVTYIGSKAFDGTAFYNTVKNWEDGVLYCGNHLISAKSDVTKITVKASTVSIAAGALDNCESLKKINVLNPKCVINCTIPKTAVIGGAEGSTAEDFAQKNNMSIDYFEECTHSDKVQVVIAATCTEQGAVQSRCADCDKLISQTFTAPLGHTMVITTPAKAPTCTTSGNTQAGYCTVCGYNEVSTVIPATGHNFGNNSANCLVCGAANPNYVAPTQPTPITTPTQPNQNDTNTSNDEDVTVTSKPKSASIKKVKGAKKAISVTWKKVSGVNGYEIQVATDKKFKKNKKTVTVKKQKTTKTTVKKLKAKKKYYVRIRTYKIVNGKKVYSSWSKVKSVKTK